jgi:hypothetical protein
MAFRSHHVPQGVIKLKKKEFKDLKQGSMTVSEYVTHFTQLSRYAPIDVDTDEKKQECFLNGLNDGLVSYPIFMPKPSTHRMHDPGSNVSHIRPKVLTDNQMS